MRSGMFSLALTAGTLGLAISSGGFRFCLWDWGYSILQPPGLINENQLLICRVNQKALRQLKPKLIGLLKYEPVLSYFLVSVPVRCRMPVHAAAGILSLDTRGLSRLITRVGLSAVKVADANARRSYPPGVDKQQGFIRFPPAHCALIDPGPPE